MHAAAVFVDTALDILAANVPAVPTDAYCLDFGCGDGAVVLDLLTRGYGNVYGCDVNPERVRRAQSKLPVEKRDHIALIQLDPYRIPFPDTKFDLILSSQVLEHVQDMGAAFRELSRIMAPNAQSLHIFPPKHRLLEAHTQVPFGNLVRTRTWHATWTRLGFRNQKRPDMTIAEHVQRNLGYLQDSTHYRTEAEIIAIATRQGLQAKFVAALAHSRKVPFGRLAARVPLADKLYSVFISKTLLLNARPASASRHQ